MSLVNVSQSAERPLSAAGGVVLGRSTKLFWTDVLLEFAEVVVKEVWRTRVDSLMLMLGTW